eukprot:5029644-Pleurochrysis_carterae.AAC.1
MARSLPPEETTHSSSARKQMLVTCAEWPTYSFANARCSTHGQRKSLTLPKSSAVASSPACDVAPLERATALTSVPSLSSGQMPRTGQPKRQL